MSERGSFFGPEPSSFAKREEMPFVRSWRERVGLWIKAATSGVDFMADWTALRSAVTLERVCGDLADAAPKRALEYLVAMVEAAREERG